MVSAEFAPPPPTEVRLARIDEWELGGKASMQHDIVVHPRCTHLVDELTLYAYKADPLTGKVLPVLEDRDNHLIDALRYACEAVRRTAVAKPAQCQPPQPIAHAWRR